MQGPEHAFLKSRLEEAFLPVHTNDKEGHALDDVGKTQGKSYYSGCTFMTNLATVWPRVSTEGSEEAPNYSRIKPEVTKLGLCPRRDTNAEKPPNDDEGKGCRLKFEAGFQCVDVIPD